MRKFLFFLAVACYGQITPSVVAPDPQQQWLNAQGKPYAGAFLCTFIAGSSTPIATYVNSTATTTNTNPIVLDATGSATIWILPNVLYKYVLYVGGNGSCPGSGAVQWTRDFISTSSAGAGGTVHGPSSTTIGNIPFWGDTFGLQITNGVTPPTGSLVGTIATQPLTNKTINITSNTVTAGSTGVIISDPTNVVKVLPLNNAALYTVPVSPTGINDFTRFDSGGYPLNDEFGAGTISVAQGVVGTLKIPDNSTIGHASAVAGYAQSGGGTAIGGAVGVYGEGRLGAVNGAWGANFNVSNYTSTHAGGFAGITWGIEVDMNNSGTGSAPNSQFGVSAVTAAFKLPTQQYVGFSAEQAASGGFQPFRIGFHSQPGASLVAFKASEQDITASNSPSQPIVYCSRDAGGVERCGQIIADLNGNVSLEAAASRAVFIGDATATAWLAVSATGTQILSGRFQGILATPASSSAACTTGEFLDDANFHYVCVGTNTWKRIALVAF